MTKFRLRRPLAITLAAAALLAGSGCGGESERDLIASARAYLEKNDAKAAVIQLKAALQQNPQSGEARFLLGEALYAAGNHAGAVVELGKAADLKYDDDAVLPILARALMMTGQAKRVTDLYARVTLRDPKAGADLKATVAAAFAAQGQLDRSLAATNAALQLEPGNVNARLLNARLTASRGAIDEAIALANELLEANPKQREALYLKGELLWFGKRDSEAAAKVFKEAISVSPRFAPAHSALLTILLSRRDETAFRSQLVEMKKALPTHPDTRFYETQQALIDRDYRRARELSQQLLRAAPENARVLQLAGAVELHGGSLLQAETHLVKALQINAELPAARRLLAESQLRMGQPAKALKALAPLLERPRPSADALALAAEAHLQSGETQRAEAFFLQASKSAPGDPRIETAIALTQIARGNEDRGLAQLEAIAARDTSTYADLALVTTRLRLGDSAGALKAIDRLQKKQPDRALTHQLRARVLEERNDMAGARASFEKALAADPQYFPALSGLAQLDLRAGKLDDARRRLEEALKRDNANSRVMLALVDVKRRIGAPPAEIAGLLLDAVRLNPTDTSARVALVDHHLANRDPKAALAAAQEAVAALRDDVPALEALGRAQMAAGETQQAVSTFGRLSSLQPTSPQPLLRLAEAQSAAQDRRAAAASLRKAIELSPRLLAAQGALMHIAIADRRFDEAIRIAREVQKERPKESAGFMMEAEAHAAARAWEPAISAANAALERRKSTADAIKLHVLYLGAGRPADADRFAANWLRGQPNDGVFISHLGSIAISSGDLALAETRYRRVLELRPQDATALNNLAWLMIRQGKPGALPLAEKANQLTPASPALMDTLASALAVDGQIGKAVELQRRVVATDSSSPGYRLNLARLLIQAGDKSAARDELLSLQKLGDKFAGQPEVATMLKTL